MPRILLQERSKRIKLLQCSEICDFSRPPQLRGCYVIVFIRLLSPPPRSVYLILMSITYSDLLSNSFPLNGPGTIAIIPWQFAWLDAPRICDGLSTWIIKERSCFLPTTIFWSFLRPSGRSWTFWRRPQQLLDSNILTSGLARQIWQKQDQYWRSLETNQWRCRSRTRTSDWSNGDHW